MFARDSPEEGDTAMQDVNTYHYLNPGDSIRCDHQVYRPGVPCLDVGSLRICFGTPNQACRVVEELVAWLTRRDDWKPIVCACEGSDDGGPEGR
jgi:hypothetical protein